MTDIIEKSLTNLLHIEPREEEKKEIVTPEDYSDDIPDVKKSAADVDIDDDYDMTRKILRNVIAQGEHAMGQLTDSVDEYGPRGYEATAQLLKSITESTKELLETQKRMAELKNRNHGSVFKDPSITVEKAVFVGTTTDLIQQMKEKKESGTE